MSELPSLLRDLRDERRAHDAELSAVTGDQMELPTSFTFETMMTQRKGEMTGADVRWMFLRRFDHVEEHTIQIEDHLENRFGIIQTQAQRYLAANEVARGDLYAALMGLSDDDLDDEPSDPPGEWSLRTILAHLVNVERSYMQNCLWAVEKFRNGEPFSPMPRGEAPDYPDATLADFVRMLDDARMESNAQLSGLSDQDLRAPTAWMNMNCDVRFRLMRFAMHEREHTAQIRKWRVQTGKPFSEAARLQGMAWQASGRLDAVLVGAPDDVLDRDSGDGEWPVRQIIAHISNAERYFQRVVREALAEAQQQPVSA
ncbi:MAG TPA: DinB family protein [Thermomicrobiales bacterium]|nr:DinB family protein [Thermomicrobiales bacterium]